MGNYCWDKVKEGVVIARVTMAGTEVNHLMIIKIKIKIKMFIFLFLQITIVAWADK